MTPIEGGARKRCVAASFEATVGGSGCPRLVEFFKKISMNARWVPFCVEYLPPNEESRSSGRQGNKKRPLSTSPTKRGPRVPEIGAPVTSPKNAVVLLFLDLFACYGIFRFPRMISATRFATSIRPSATSMIRPSENACAHDVFDVTPRMQIRPANSWRS